MDLGQIIIFFAIAVAYTFAIVNTIFYLLDCEYRAPDAFEKLCLVATLAGGIFFCLAAIMCIECFL